MMELAKCYYDHLCHHLLPSITIIITVDQLEVAITSGVAYGLIMNKYFSTGFIINGEIPNPRYERPGIYGSSTSQRKELRL
jgi:hypothetical protein